MGLTEGIAKAIEAPMRVVVHQEGLTQNVAGLRIVAAGAIESQTDTGRGNRRLPTAQCLAKQPQLHSIPGRIVGMVFHPGFPEVLDQQAALNGFLGYGVAQTLDPSVGLEPGCEDLVYPMACLREGDGIVRAHAQTVGRSTGHQ